MKSLGSTGSLLAALAVVLLAFISTGNSFKQELWFYDAQNNTLQFDSHVPDTSDYSLFLPKVTRVCTRGKWYLFSIPNFQNYSATYGGETSSGIKCYNFTTAASVKSFRYIGASDTDTNALSLYKGSLNSGKESFVTAQSYTGITSQIIRFALTGPSGWRFFEGQELDGKSKCYKLLPGWYVDFDDVSSLGLTRVGSVYRGCNLQEIQNYKMSQTS